MSPTLSFTRHSLENTASTATSLYIGFWFSSPLASVASDTRCRPLLANTFVPCAGAIGPRCTPSEEDDPASSPSSPVLTQQ